MVAKDQVGFRKTKPKYTMAEFMRLPQDVQVGFILSDGQWYTADKIRSIMRLKNDGLVQPIIDKMVEDGKLLKHPYAPSYRMSYEQLKDWRSKHGVAEDEQIIDRILYPRIFGTGSKRCTEVELFQQVPLHRIGYVNFMLATGADVKKLKKDMGYIGDFKEVAPGKYKLHCLAANYVRQKLAAYEQANGGPGTFFQPRSLNSYNVSYRRELYEFDQNQIADLIRFYVQFGQVLVPLVKKTFDAYLPDSDKIGIDGKSSVRQLRESLVMGWIIKIIRKYKEKDPTPFAAYIMKALPKEAFDFAASQIGKDLNKFQLEKVRAINNLKKIDKKEGREVLDYYSDEQLLKIMHEHGYDITLDEFRAFDEDLKTWQKTRSPQSLQWSETGEERRVEDKRQDSALVMASDATADLESQFRIQRAVVRAALDTEDWDSAIRILGLLANSTTLTEALARGDVKSLISDRFRDALARGLSYRLID